MGASVGMLFPERSIVQSVVSVCPLSARQFSVDVKSKDRSNEGQGQDQDDNGITNHKKNG